MEKTVKKLKLCQESPKDDLAYWLSRPVEERFAEVERLTREKYGPLGRLDKTKVRIIKLSEDI